MKPRNGIESAYWARYLFLNAVDITDYKVFPTHEIENSPPVFHFRPSEDRSALLPLLDQVVPSDAHRDPGMTMDRYLERNGTSAFLVIQNDQLLFERYYNGCDHSQLCTSFSTVKSLVSALIGIALQEGLIDGLDDPITKFLPELSRAHSFEITIRHLLSMSSGLRYHAGFLPWDDDPRVYYSPDLRTLARSVKTVGPPGVQFHYNNYNLVLLGLILERVTSGSVSAYLQEKIWKPLGMEYAASWSLDSASSGMEKMESGLNARAVDFAKFGRLYLHLGDWNGKQVVPESWVRESTQVEPGAQWTNYKYLWWIPRAGKGRFMAVGNLGQFIYVAPDKDCVLVRFGRGKPRGWQGVYPKMFGSLAALL